MLKKNFVRVVFAAILFIFNNNFAKDFDTQKFEFIKSEIQKCDFLENKFLPKKELASFKTKLFKICIQFGVPIFCSFLLCKIIDSFFIYPRYSLNSKEFMLSFLKEYRKELDKLIENKKIYFNFDKLGQQTEKLYEKRRKINTVIFSTLFLGTFFLTRFLLKTKHPTELQIVTNFIKDWENNKINIPESFQEKFGVFFSKDIENKKNSLTEAQALYFVKNMICEIIDYRACLRKKLYKASSFFLNS